MSRGLNDEQVGWLQPLVSTVANSVQRKFPMLDRGDLEQEGWVWAVTHVKQVEELLTLEDEDESNRLLAYRIRQAMRTWAIKEKAQVQGYEVDDLYFYTNGELATLLGVVFDKEAWLKAPETDGEKPRGADPAVGGNWVAILADVAQAYNKLDQEDQDLLHLRYAQELTTRQVATLYAVDHATISRRCDRALDRLQDQLGGERPWEDIGGDRRQVNLENR